MSRAKRVLTWGAGLILALACGWLLLRLAHAAAAARAGLEPRRRRSVRRAAEATAEGLSRTCSRFDRGPASDGRDPSGTGGAEPRSPRREGFDAARWDRNPQSPPVRHDRHAKRPGAGNAPPAGLGRGVLQRSVADRSDHRRGRLPPASALLPRKTPRPTPVAWPCGWLAPNPTRATGSGCWSNCAAHRLVPWPTPAWWPISNRRTRPNRTIPPRRWRISWLWPARGSTKTARWPTSVGSWPNIPKISRGGMRCSTLWAAPASLTRSRTF